MRLKYCSRHCSRRLSLADRSSAELDELLTDEPLPLGKPGAQVSNAVVVWPERDPFHSKVEDIV